MLLEVANLSVDLETPPGLQRVVDGGTFSWARGKASASSASPVPARRMTALALMGLTPENALVSGSIRFEEQELVGLGEDAMRALRGDRIAMVFQEPMTALNPLHRVGAQVAEPLMLHRGIGKKAALEEAVRLLDHVRLADPERARALLPVRALRRRAAARHDRDGDRVLAASRHRR